MTPLAVALAALCVLGWLALLLWHRRQMSALRAMDAKARGWRRISPGELHEARACPGCRALVCGWRDRVDHAEVCAQLEDLPDAPKTPKWTAVTVSDDAESTASMTGIEE